ncbi:MAG: type IX secretion system outer membrane channel protein PorV [Bacteroidota bacterium]
MRKVLLFTILSSFLAFGANAQGATGCLFENGNYVTQNGNLCPNAVVSAVPFLGITPDARSGAMGDVAIALSPDANAMHANASKLAFAEQDFSISATYTPWLQALQLQDVYLAYLSGYKKLSDLEAVGVSLRFFSLGSISFTDQNGQPLGTGKPNEFELKGSYARKLSDNLSAAIGAKLIYSNLAAGQRVNGTGEEIEAGIGGAADISLTYEKPSDAGVFRAGLAVTNIGSKITYTNSVRRDFLPANLGIGAAYEFELDSYNKITIAADINKALVPTPCLDDPTTPQNECDEDGDGFYDYKDLSPIRGVFTSFGDAPGGAGEEFREIFYSVGAEYWYDEQFSIRTGYYFEDQSKGARQYLTVGLGLRYNIFGLNFSYLVPTTNQRNPLDNTLRFSLLFNFGDAVGAEEL